MCTKTTRSIAKSLSLYILAAATVMTAATGSDCLALCNTSVPIPPELAENDPQYVELCGLVPEPGGAPIPCPAPNPPTLALDSERAQAMVVKANVPYSDIESASASWWEVWYKRPDGQLVKLWEYRSTEGIPPDGLAPGGAVTLRAPGLESGNVDHQFRVAFEDSAGRKTCYSPLSSPFQTTTFGTGGPSLPEIITQQVEDDFHGPTATAQQDDGDGLGPEEVWLNDFGGASSRAWVVEDQDAAFLQPSAQAHYQEREATDAHSVAEVQVRKVPDGSPKYNFDVVVRRHFDGVNLKYYLAKLVNGWRGWDTPSLVVGRWNETIGATTLPDEAWNELPTGTGTCTVAPPFGDGTPVWFRVEVKNIDNDTTPVVTVSVTWNEGGAEHVCSLERQDLFDPGNMKSVLGTWGFWAHEHSYYVDLFRAGSEVP